jgi:hypothetical protein
MSEYFSPQEVGHKEYPQFSMPEMPQETLFENRDKLLELAKSVGYVDSMDNKQV